MTADVPQKIPRGQTPERKAYMKAYHAANPPRNRRAYKAAYDLENKEKIAAYRKRTKAQMKAYCAERYRKNRTATLARVKAYTEANKEKVLKYHSRYHAANTEKVQTWARAWRRNNPERKAHHSNTRRARKAGNGGSHTLEELVEKFSSMGNACYYCGSSGRMSVDHMTPLSRGGRDDIQNIVPACRSCNSRKNIKTAQEYFAVLQRTQ